jgi:hypothetical protein
MNENNTVQNLRVHNSGVHVCVEVLRKKHFTISVRLPDDKRVIFGFVPHHKDPADYECVDIHLIHDGRKVPDAGGQLVPAQKVSVHHPDNVTTRTQVEGVLTTLRVSSEHYKEHPV